MGFAEDHEMAKKTTAIDEIVDVALEIAHSTSWESLRLCQVAERLDISLKELARHIREKEDIAEAWFDRADSAMLAQVDTAEFGNLSTRQRLKRLIIAWLKSLSPRRRVTREIICSKFEPLRLDRQLAGLTRTRRSVQWMRDASKRYTPLPWRMAEETVLSGIFVATFCYWMWDDSDGSTRTVEYLDRSLGCVEQLSRWLPSFIRYPRPPRHPEAASAPAAGPAA